MSTVETAGTCTAILDELERAVVGRRRTLELVLIGILAGGHVLLEDLPGLGKTLIARSFARVLGLEFARIQFTPDLLPSDVVGAPLYDQRNAEMVFRPGPVFTQLLLAARLAERHGVHLYQNPDAARRLLCRRPRDADLWPWIDPEQTLDADERAGQKNSIPGRTLSRLITRLEQL